MCTIKVQNESWKEEVAVVGEVAAKAQWDEAEELCEEEEEDDEGGEDEADE